MPERSDFCDAELKQLASHAVATFDDEAVSVASVALDRALMQIRNQRRAPLSFGDLKTVLKGAAATVETALRPRRRLPVCRLPRRGARDRNDASSDLRLCRGGLSAAAGGVHLGQAINEIVSA
jgi:hypothetical protein